MPAAAVDLTISSRWILPMTSPGEVLENHTLAVRDGRILDVLPTALAADRYTATIEVDRSEHLVLPGLVNAHAQIAPLPGHTLHPQRLHDGALLRIAEMLKSGTTCFCGLGYFPEESARTAAEQGLRALIGIPIAETASAWAKSPGEYLTRALNFRDEYRGHPTIATAFAPDMPVAISDGTFGRIATLADELDSGVLIALHESRAAVDESVIRYGMRPIERMHSLGLLTPALTAAQMVHVSAADIALAQRSGIAITLCPEANFRAGNGPPPVASWASSGLRLSLGGGVGAGLDLWTALRFLALLSHAAGASSAPGASPAPDASPTPGTSLAPRGAGGALQAWDALAVVTRGGAAALGLDAEIGTLEKGKWADLCCVDLRGPSMRCASLLQPNDPAAQLVWNGGRDIVSDVWVSGRHLLNDGAFTRLDWPMSGSCE
jgi:5-methylthioadenosine/S-adenosylhomocysteine deaminase